jgi:radical SAM protein with 4Fe4S-binding SPASM domain
MFGDYTVPYFPFKLIPERDGWLIHNPLTGDEHELNQATYWLLKLCDGYRTWSEILADLGRTYQGSSAHVKKASQTILQELTNAGMLWWRQQRMQWWRVPPPRAVLWGLTNKCNLSCQHCVVNAGSFSQEELSLKACRRISEELAIFGVKELILSGGEPLMRKDFFEIAEHASSKGLSLQLATNAILITKPMAQRLSAIRANAQVSLDGATPEVHDNFRKRSGSWNRAVRGIRNLVDAGVPVMIAAVVTKNNIAEISALYNLAADLGAHTFRILPFVPYGRGRKALELEVSPREMREVTAFLRQQRNEGGLSVVKMEFECTFTPPPSGEAHPQTHIGCDGALAYCGITSSGEVLPCNFFEGVEAENLKEHSFAWIWEKSRFLNYFRSLTVSDIQGTCQLCTWLPVCRGSCIATNFAHGDIFQSNCHCWMVNGEISSGISLHDKAELYD